MYRRGYKRPRADTTFGAEAKFAATVPHLKSLEIHTFTSEADWDDAPVMPTAFKEAIRLAYSWAMIYSGHYDHDRRTKSSREDWLT
jgi:N-ethylmaleimide reductase